MWPYFPWYRYDRPDLSPVPDGPGAWEEGGPATPSRLDVELVRIIYEEIALRSACPRCGCWLRHRLTMDAGRPAVREASWTLWVSSRCRGWRRHRCRAYVALDGDGLRLGSFEPG